MEWVQKRSGKKKTAPAAVGNDAFPPMEKAPGLYVVEEV
jgi:polyhydroxyalkanoate synthase